MRPRRLVFLAFAAGLPLALAACNGQKEAAKIPDRPVLIREAVFKPRIAERSFVATIRPRVESDLGFRVAGKVARRLVEVGEAVRAGQALAGLDTADFTLQREQAAAEQAAARAAFVNARAEMDRVEALRDKGWSTAATLDRARAALEEARGRQERAEKAAQLATNALGYATLTADADGVITAASVEPGQVVAAGQPAIRLARLGEKEAVIALPEAQVEWARRAQAKVSLWSAPERLHVATLRELSPSADPVTRTYQARYSLPDLGEAAALGMTATLSLSDAGAGEVARVPLGAILNDGQGPSVFVVEKETQALVRKPVTVAGYESREALIASGIANGDRVVALGVHKLEAGQRVRVVDALAF